MKPLQITSYTLTTALGIGASENWQKLRDGSTGLRRCHFFDIKNLQTYVGQIDQLEGRTLESAWEKFDCRNNRLTHLCLQQDNFIPQVEDAIARYGAERVGVFMGTSTSGIHHTEQAYLHRDIQTDKLPDWYHYETTHNIYAAAEFVRAYLGIEGVSSTISTACSSSAKVFASAHRAIESGLCDAAIVGGADSLCLTTLYGFHSLQLVSEDVCRPSDRQRSGISIGEAAGFALLERPNGSSTVGLLGYGESSDAYHMSAPHPEGEGARLAMQGALNTACLEPADIDYIHLHGTGTISNDVAEAKAVSRLFGNQVPCSSTKSWTGHTLGATGIVGAVFSLLSIENNFMPCSLHTRDVDPDIQTNILLDSVQFDPVASTEEMGAGGKAAGKNPVRYVLNNAFGFGGSNCSLLLGELS